MVHLQPLYYELTLLPAGRPNRDTVSSIRGTKLKSPAVNQQMAVQGGED